MTKSFLLQFCFPMLLRRRKWVELLAFALLLLSGVVARAQSSAFNGHITDTSGAAISGASVEIENVSTGIVTKVVTNADGYYLAPPLEPGAYTLRAKAESFGESVVKDIRLEVGAARTVDVALKPVSAAETVTVEATEPELAVDHADRGNVIESQFVQSMPLNIRNPLQMVNFAQGVTAYSQESGNNDQSEAFTNTFRINGGKLATTESLLDGGANTTPYDYNAVASVPQVDSIQEFKVLTTAYAAEWGRTSGGIVTFATKAGTDHFHGSAFEYLRNSLIDANSFNADAAGQEKPHFQRNQFGFALGGPFVFPPHVRNSDHKTFFFVTYEGLRQSQAGNSTYTVPTALERTGDFSQTFDTNGNLITIYDPSTTTLQQPGSTQCTATPVATGQTVYCRTPFAGNKITNLDPVGKAILNSYPLPNQHGQGASSVNNYFSASPTSSTQNTVNFRFDHRFNDHHSVFVHYDWFQRWNNYGDPYHNNLSPTGNPQRLPGDNTMLDHTWVLSPLMVFEHHFVYTHQESNRTPLSEGFDPTSLGFNGNVTAGLTAQAFPSVSSTNRLSSIGPLTGLEADGGTVYQYAGALSWLKGKHAIKAGLDYRFIGLDYHINQLVTVTASSNFTGGPNPTAAIGDSGSGVADLLLGTGTVGSGIVPGFRTTHPYWAFFAQDEYHVTPKLTITYGLRYNLELADQEAHNQNQFLDLSSTSPLNGKVNISGTLKGGPGFVGVNGAGSSLQHSQYLNFDPRFGFAYSLDKKTVVHGGFGIFHAPAMINLGSSSSQGYSALTNSNPTEPNGVTPQFNMDNPFPDGLTQPSGSSQGLLTNVGLSIGGYPRQQQVSYSEQWSLDVQRMLPANIALTVGYVGNNGIHLYVPYNYNQLPDSDLSMGTQLTATVANPFYGVITNPTSPLAAKTVQYGQLLRPMPQFQNVTGYMPGYGHSNYNALQVSAERRFSQGLALLFAYTYSKMMDNVGDYLISTQFQDAHCSACDWSVSQQDLTHVLRISGEYELPMGHGKPFAQHGLGAAVLGGWSVGAFYTFDNGAPVQVTSPNNSNSFGGGTTMRPNIVPEVSRSAPGGRKIVNGGAYFNPAAFTPTPAFQFGNAPRYLSDVRAPGTNNWDMLVGRQIPLHEQFALNFKMEFFNMFNRVQFAGPNASISSSSFGYIFLNQTNTPREIQASLRLSF